MRTGLDLDSSVINKTSGYVKVIFTRAFKQESPMNTGFASDLLKPC